jgi:molecular chaperone DnaK (HSP70)
VSANEPSQKSSPKQPSADRRSDDAAAGPSGSRFVVGIDLGTTNCAAAYVDTRANVATGDWRVETFLIPQWVDWGQVERRTTLPSFHYELPPSQSDSLSGGLPWETGAGESPTVGGGSQPGRFAVGTLARDAGMRRPGRRIASAKSWLSHDGVDRSAPLLPWQGDPDVGRHSPVEISARYLGHIRKAWDAAHPDDPLDQQDVVITLPASFDEVARELTVAAARAAGLPRVFLIEEPQAAFYAWINRHRDDWHTRVSPGQMILVCDIGGGTTDFTLIRVRPAGDDSAGDRPTGDVGNGGGQVQFHRVAVGKHLILGGDNLDLALARFAESKLTAGPSEKTPAGTSPPGDQSPLAPRDWDRMIQAARVAKETMLDDQRPESFTLTIASESAKLIAAARSVVVTAEEIDQVLVDGFFPVVSADARPEAAQSGFREFGLPYASDPAITRHLAEFLASHARSGLESGDVTSAVRPDWVLFNGGVMSAGRLRKRLIDSVVNWFGGSDGWAPVPLDADQLDLAVAHGAAYFGMVRRGFGVRIAANLGRSYFLQVSDSPPETICLVPGSAQSGQRFAPQRSLELQLGEPVQFPLWVSSTRLADAPGDLVAIDRGELSPLPPIRTVLNRGKQKSNRTIHVRMESELSEIGTLGLFCAEADSGKRWRLEFDIRSTLQTDREAHLGAGESFGIVDSDVLAACDAVIRKAFDRQSGASAKSGPGSLAKRLKEATGIDRTQWPPSLLRGIWQSLMTFSDGRRLSAAHETAWLSLTGYCLRPGYGMAVDDWRVGEVWRSVHGKLAFAAAGSRTESLILWRRIAGGMTAGQQEQLVAPLVGTLAGKPSPGGKSPRPEPHEAAEIWRMVGALEHIAASTKAVLTTAAISELRGKRSEPYRDAILWACGRLASRRPVYGPLNTVIAADRAEPIIDELLDDTNHLAIRQLAAMQIAQRTEDRYRDLATATRQRVADWLERTGAPARYIAAVREGGQSASEDAAAIFGESLPLGIRLVNG